MKIKKGLFITEIEFDIDEIGNMIYRVPPHMAIGLLRWLKQNFKLDMLPKLSNTNKKDK